jgi:predicted Zn-dependent protease
MVRLSTGLPYTRRQEREADELALHHMAQACFDPRVSAELHKVMNRDPSGRLGFVAKHGINSERMDRLRCDGSQ